MESLSKKQRQAAFERYLTVLEEKAPDLPPASVPLLYDVWSLIEEVRWDMPIIDMMVRDDLSELTNTLNQWADALRRWHAWLDVLAAMSRDDAWAVQWEFVEPLAYQCMFQPSAARDRMVYVAIRAFHQVRLAQQDEYEDRLPFDPATPNDKPHHPSRRQKERLLGEIVDPWASGKRMMDTIRALDGVSYRKSTGNFRNLASHAIAPRFEVGITKLVERSVVKKTEMKQRDDGAYDVVPVPNAMSVSYGFGGTPPLSMREVATHNLQEYEKAAACWNAYVHLLDEALKVIPRATREPPNAS